MKSWCVNHGVRSGMRCVECHRGTQLFGELGENSVIYTPAVVLNPEMIRVGDWSRIDSFCKVEGGHGVTIGSYVHIASFVHIGLGGGTVEIGDYAAISSGATVISGSNIVDGADSGSASAPAEMQIRMYTKTVIGESAFLGAKCTLMPGVKIGKGAVVGAGALVLSDVEDNQIVTGVPAKFVRMRREA